MSSTYPNTLDSFATNRLDSTTMATTHATDHNNANDAINKIELELGVGPKGVYSDVATRLSTLASTTQTGTTYTLVANDNTTVVQFTSASAVTVTIPPHSSVALPTGAQIELFQAGSGTVTVQAGAGVTLHSPGGTLSTATQYATLVLWQITQDTWVISGELASTSIDKTIINAKGDIVVGTANDTPSVLSVGTDSYVLKANSTQTSGLQWTRPKDLLELQGAALGLVSMNYAPSIAQGNTTSPTSQSLYAMRIGLRQGMAITGLMFNIITAASGTSPTGAYVGIIDPSNVVRVQSGNLNTNTAWTSLGFQTFSFGSTYTVPSDGAYAAFLLINGGWGTTSPIFLRNGGTMQDDIRFDFRQGSLTAPPANGSSVTPVATATLHIWVGCVGS